MLFNNFWRSGYSSFKETKSRIGFTFAGYCLIYLIGTYSSVSYVYILITLPLISLLIARIFCAVSKSSTITLNNLDLAAKSTTEKNCWCLHSIKSISKPLNPLMFLSLAIVSILRKVAYMLSTLSSWRWFYSRRVLRAWAFSSASFCLNIFSLTDVATSRFTFRASSITFWAF